MRRKQEEQIKQQQEQRMKEEREAQQRLREERERFEKQQKELEERTKNQNPDKLGKIEGDKLGERDKFNGESEGKPNVEKDSDKNEKLINGDDEYNELPEDLDDTTLNFDDNTRIKEEINILDKEYITMSFLEREKDKQKNKNTDKKDNLEITH